MAKYYIPTEEVKEDLRLTEQEAKDLQDQLDILNKNPIDNKMEIYLKQGKLAKRKEFITLLKDILKERTDA